MGITAIAMVVVGALASCRLVVGPLERDVDARDAGPTEGEGEGDGEGEGTIDAGPMEGEGEGEDEWAPDAGPMEGEGEGEWTIDAGPLPAEPPPSCLVAADIAMGDTAVCYVDGEGDLYCAGERGGVVFGASFVSAGHANVEQVLVSGNGIFGAVCVRDSGGAARCIGHDPSLWNALRSPDGTQPGATWRQWGPRFDIAALTTATWDALCARHWDGTAECTAFVCGIAGEPQRCPWLGVDSPDEIVAVPGDVWSLWQDNFGMLHINDEALWRAGDGRSDCIVTAAGLSCGGVLRSPPSLAGRVIDGGIAVSPPEQTACWLTVDGAVSCDNQAAELFPGMRKVALAVSATSAATLPGLPSVCAIVEDGSVWCTGNNASGRLGAGHQQELVAETQVAPPGSARVRCLPGEG